MIRIQEFRNNVFIQLSNLVKDAQPRLPQFG